MRAAIFFLLCLTTVAWASQNNIVKDFDPSKPEPLCMADGQYLLHGQNRCKFLRCTYGSGSWKDTEGNTRFYAVERSCPYGTAVSRTAYGNGHNTGLDERRLCADRVAPHHGGIRYHDPCNVEVPYYPAYNTHPTHYTTKHSKHTTYTESKTKPHTPSKPQHPAYNPKPQHPAYNSKPQHPAYNSKPQHPAYNSKPQFPAYNSKPQFPAYNPYAAHFPSFHYQVRKADAKNLIEKVSNDPTTDKTKPSFYSHYGHPAAYYPAYPSAYNHHPYPAYINYPPQHSQEETEEVEEVVEGDLPDPEQPEEAQNQVLQEAPVEEEKYQGEVEEVIKQEVQEEEATPEEAPEAEVYAPDIAADPMGEQAVMEGGAEIEEGGEESRDTGYVE